MLLGHAGRQAGGVEVKAVAMDDKLVVHLHRKDSLGPPATIELDVDTIATESPSEVPHFAERERFTFKYPDFFVGTLQPF